MSRPPVMKLHRHRKKPKDEPATFHPPILFCGECSACSAPPPPIQSASFTISSDEESQHAPSTRANNVKFMHLRVYGISTTDNDNASEDEGVTERIDILKTILKGLDGVKDVAVSESHLPPRAEHAEFATAQADSELVDPTSCMVKIEYEASSNDTGKASDPLAAVTDNPQEPNEGNDEDPIRQAITTRISEAGFDFALHSDSTNADPGDEQAADGDAPSMAFCLPICEPPVSCRTRLRVQGICCSSEVPAVRSIVKRLPGVRKLGVNVATKVVFVDHDPGIITASLLAEALNEERFGAEILTDGGLELMNDGSAEQDGSSSELDNFLNMPRSRFVESTFFIPGMITYTNERMESCPIGKLLRQNFFKDHLRAFHLHASSRTLKVEHDPELLGADKIMDVLVRGLKDGEWGNIELAHDGAAEGLTLPELTHEHRDDGDGIAGEGKGTLCEGMKINVIISGIFWVLSLLGLIGEKWAYLKYAGIVSVLAGMPPVVVKAWKTLRRRQFDANCMMVTAAFGALLLGEFDEAASVSFLFAISELLEARATRTGRRALGEIISLRPEYANVVDPKAGGIVIVPAANIPVGSLVSVRTGDKVPADGVVVEGTSSVDESSLTGEARPVEKHVGEDVSGGSINVGSRQLVVRTTTTVGDSTLSRLIQLVEEAQANTSETEQLVDAFARKYTPVVLAIALSMCTIPWIYGEETGRRWMHSGLIFIIIACPCALTISTPVTYSAGLAAAAQRGIIIKGGSKLEALGNVKTVLFDKTGTITTGRFTLSHLELVGNLKSRDEVLELLAIMEAPSSHPLSACLVSAAKAEGVVVPTNVSLTEHTILKGEGVTANVNDENVYVGNERLFRRLDMYNISIQCVESAKKWSEEGGTVGYVGILGMGIIGMFCVKDTIRDEAQEVISALQCSGNEVALLTGDSEGAAQAVGEAIGLEKACIRSHLLPEDKLNYISDLKGSSTNKHASILGKKELILMVGDGVNDAPALSVADVGVAMGEGASVAMEMSDITLMDSNLTKLLFSMNMGAKVIATVKENIAFSVLVNLVAVAFTVMGKMTLFLAIICDVGVMLIVTLNGMKLLSKRTVNSIEGAQLRRPASKRKDGQNYLMPGAAVPEMEMV